MENQNPSTQPVSDSDQKEKVVEVSGLPKVQPQSNKIWIVLLVISMILLGLIVLWSLYLYNQVKFWEGQMKMVEMEMVPREEVRVAEGIDVSSTEMEVPADWVKFTATDSYYGYETSLYLPPSGEYDFKFTGSEFYIGKLGSSSDDTEFWDYKGSFFPDDTKEGIEIENRYDGSSRRQWFMKYLNEDHPWQVKTDSNFYVYNTVDEVEIGDKSYLDIVVVDSMDPESGPIRAILYVENDILHMFTRYSEEVTDMEDILDEILYSLESKALPIPIPAR